MTVLGGFCLFFWLDIFSKHLVLMVLFEIQKARQD